MLKAYAVVLDGRAVLSSLRASLEQVVQENTYHKIEELTILNKVESNRLEKTLKWIVENPGAHPENIKRAVKDLYDLLS